jgi:signal peptidase II
MPGDGEVAVPHPADDSDEAPTADPAAAVEQVRARPSAVAVLVATGAVALAIDVITKQLMLASLEHEPPVRLIAGVLYLNITRNPGAAFSIGVDYTFIFPVIAVIVLAGIGYLARRLRSLPWAVAMGLIVGGALGNLMDRLFRAPAPLHGHVVDFISVFDEAGRAFPIFNIADSSLFCGVVLAIFLEFTGRRRDGTREVRARKGERTQEDSGGSNDNRTLMRDSRREGG